MIPGVKGRMRTANVNTCFLTHVRNMTPRVISKKAEFVVYLDKLLSRGMFARWVVDTDVIGALFAIRITQYRQLVAQHVLLLWSAELTSCWPLSADATRTVPVCVFLTRSRRIHSFFTTTDCFSIVPVECPGCQYFNNTHQVFAK